MEALGLDHVQLAAPPGCEREARRFFGELLGLQEVEKPQSLRDRGGVWFQLGPNQIRVGVADSHKPALKAHPAVLIREEDLDDLAARLHSAGERVAWDEDLPGARRFFSSDPWGNRIEFLAYT